MQPFTENLTPISHLQHHTHASLHEELVRGLECNLSKIVIPPMLRLPPSLAFWRPEMKAIYYKGRRRMDALLFLVDKRT